VVGNTGPVYIPHVHGQHYGSSPHQYNQYPTGVNYGTSYNPLTKDIQGGYYSTHPVVSQGIITGGIPKDIPVVQSYPSQSTNDTQMCHPIQSVNNQISVCPHRQLYTAPLAVNTATHSSDMPQQWSFLKLPPINTISPCSSTHFSQSEECSSSEEQTTRSTISSPSEVDSPLWDETKSSSCSM
jgi:hypothetical protein